MPLIAYDNAGSRYFSVDVGEEIRCIDLFCRGCNEKMSFVNSHGKRKNFFRHRIDSNCNYYPEPESPEHAEMKLDVFEKIKIANNLSDDQIQLEVPINNQIADILIKLPTGELIAIECQCSVIGSEKIMQRTMDYSNKVIFVLWILNTKNLKGRDYNRLKFVNDKTTNTAKIERELHKIYDGLVWYYDLNEHNIFSLQFKDYSDYRDNHFTNQPELITFKKKKEFHIGTIQNHRLFLKHNKKGVHIATFEGVNK